MDVEDSDDDICPPYAFDYHARRVPPLQPSPYGVTLARIEEGDLEYLRFWRNRPEIRATMVYREKITREMQQAWFASIDNQRNHYSLILDQRWWPVGTTHTKNIDLDAMTGEGGMLIWDPSHRSTLLPFRAAVTGMDWMFFKFGLRRLTVRVLADNRRALRYNRALGYVFDREEDGVKLGYVTPELYSEKVDAIRRLLEDEPPR